MRLVKRAIKRALTSHAGWRASAWARPRGVLVLTYHRVCPADDTFPGLDVRDFAWQMEWLKRNVHLIEPEALREEAERERERPAVLVTFDDGFRDYHDHAYPVLHALGIPSIVFLSTGFMDDGGLLWADALFLAVTRSPHRRVAAPWGEDVDLGTDGARREFLKRAKARLKAMPHAEKEEAVARLLAALEADVSAGVGRQMLSWEEVRRTAGLTRFGGHTHTHPILPRAEPAHREREIRTCRERIAAELGAAPTTFAYPNGGFDADTVAEVRRQGFDTAFSTIEGVNGRATDWMAVRRVGLGLGRDDFAWQVSGLWARRTTG